MNRQWRDISAKIGELADMLDFTSVANLVMDLEGKCDEQEAEIDGLRDRIAELEADANG